MNQQDGFDKLTTKWIKKLEEEGVGEVSVVTLEPNPVPHEHTHEQVTTYVIKSFKNTVLL